MELLSPSLSLSKPSITAAENMPSYNLT